MTVTAIPLVLTLGVSGATYESSFRTDCSIAPCHRELPIVSEGFALKSARHPPSSTQEPVPMSRRMLTR